MTSLLIIVVLFALMWVLLIRPQRRRQQQTHQMLDSLEVGDEVVTAGGIYGQITALDDGDVWVEIAPELTVRVARRAIAALVEDEDEEEEKEDEETPELSEESKPTASEHG